MAILNLQLQQYANSLKVRQSGTRRQVWATVRRKWVALTPEEMVRQLFISYLLQAQLAEAGRLSVEKEIVVLGLKKRCDVVVYDKFGTPQMIVECKRSDIPLDSATLQQAANYNMTLKVPNLVVTNGHDTAVFAIDHDKAQFKPLTFIPKL